MGAASHRRGGRTALLRVPSGPKASAVDLLSAVNDRSACEAIALGARVRYRTTASAYETSVAGLARIGPDQLEPVRRPPSYHEMRNYIGRCAVPTRGEPRSVWFESLTELGHLRNLIASGHVVEVATQPFMLVWSVGNGTIWHVPDIAVRLDDGHSLVVDVTRRERLTTPRRIAIFELAAATLARAGWRYEVRTELSDQRLANLSNICACRHVSDRQRDRWLGRVDEVTNWPIELAALGRRIDAQCSVAAALHLVSLGHLFLDLDDPIVPSTPVYREPPSEGAPEWIAMS